MNIDIVKIFGSSILMFLEIRCVYRIEW